MKGVYSIMATYHFTVKSKAKGYATSHFQYIARLAQYSLIRETSQEKIEYVVHGACMPSWVKSPIEFWQAADTYERANAKAYMEYEFALPNELTIEARKTLVTTFLDKYIAQHQYPHSYAIHNVKSRISGEDQPHCHMMFSLRADDGLDRTAERYFKRYNNKAPDKGGVRKKQLQEGFEDYSAFLLFIRKAWENHLNDALAQHVPYQVFHVNDQTIQIPNRVSADNYENYNAEHGTFYLPEPKLGTGKQNESIEYLEEIKCIREHNQRELELERIHALNLNPEMLHGIDDHPYTRIEVNHLANKIERKPGYYEESLLIRTEQNRIDSIRPNINEKNQNKPDSESTLSF